MKHNSAKQSRVTRGGTSEILLSPFPSSSVVTLIDHIIIVNVVNIIVNINIDSDISDAILSRLCKERTSSWQMGTALS